MAVSVPAPARRLTQGEQSMLNELQFRWGEIYRIAATGWTWAAVRWEGGRNLVAASATELREKIVADLAAQS